MKMVLISCGWFFVVLAALGIFVPLLPTVPFLLLAAACFAKSSERFHQWLLNHRVFGDMIHHWQQTRSIPKKSKYIAIFSIVISGAISLYLIDTFAIKVMLVILLTIPIVVLLRLPISENIVVASPSNKESS